MLHNKWAKIIGVIVMTTLLSAEALAARVNNPMNSPGVTASATAAASVEIITPISIGEVRGINFGSYAPGSTDGTVVMSTSGVRTVTGGATLGNAVAATPGVYMVTGQSNTTYSIAISTSTVATSDSGANIVTLNSITSNIAGSTGVLSADGTQTLNVGATLHLPSTAVSGTYSGTFSITVTYN